jgi:uncharacterized protein YggT (Ycf19 family)
MSQSKQPLNNEVVTPTGLKFSKVIVWIMYIWVLIGVISLSIRVFLLAFSANTSAGFTNFILNVSNDYLQPFRGIFPSKPVGETGYLDVSALFAIIIYLFILWGFRSLIDYVQNKIDLDKEMQYAKIAEAKRLAEIARQEELDRIAAENLKEILKPVKKQTTTKTTRVVS